MKNYIAIALLASMGVAFTGCNDFLDDNRYPKTSIINTPEYWSNENNVQLQVDRFTDELSQAYGSGGSGGWFFFRNLSDDQVASSFANWTYPTLSSTSGDWTYSNIRGVSYILQGVESSTLTGAVRQNFLGIARMVRAYSYYNLVRKFGDVVWVDEVVEPDYEDKDVLYGPRTNRDVVMDHVLEDLQFAIENISAESSQSTWSKDYARAILSEVALYEGTYCRYRNMAENNLAPDEARAKKWLEISAEASKALLNKYGFSDDYQAIYNSLWQDLSANPELIVGRRYDATNGRHSTISYTCSSTTTSGMSLDGFKAFLFKDGKPYGQTAENETLIGVPVDNDSVKTLDISNLLAVRDARLSIITDPIVYYKGMEGSRAGATGMNSSSGFGVAKYDNINLPLTARNMSSQNYTSAPIYWTSYIALNYAEAKAELNDFSQADFDMSIKKLYERAGLTMLNSPAALSAVNDPQAAKDGVSSLIFEIRRCRRCELMFDNWIRYWDLIRWNQLVKLDSKKNPDILRGAYVANSPVPTVNMDEDGYYRHYTNEREYDKKYNLYPIPTGQIQLNNSLTQNYGWNNN